jgi:hypothetical protein
MLLFDELNKTKIFRIKKCLIIFSFDVFNAYTYTSGGTRCKEDAIYVFHLQQCSSRHPPDLSIGIYPSCIKDPHILLSRPTLASVILEVVTQRALAVFHTSFPSVMRPLLYPFSCHAPGLFFHNFSHLFISSFLLVLSRYAYDIQLCSF